MIRNIVLIGFMAAGKSSVGRLLAQELGWDFIDTDQRIEEVTGMKIPELFRKYGEKRMRSEENLIIKKISAAEQTVVATGGGTILNTENRQILTKLGMTIHLYVPLDIALQRVKRRQDRPLLNKSDCEIEKMWQERLGVYNLADITIDTTGRDINSIVSDILSLLKGGYINATKN